MSEKSEARTRAHKGWHARGYLPHFDGGAVTQTITFRLADSMPSHIYDEISADAASDEDLRESVDEIMDEGRGTCLLKELENAVLVQAALQHFDGERYRLIAWAIMPNHVHVMIEQIAGYPLDSVVHSWKSYTANQINKRRAARGAVWATDYFDRYVRDEAHYNSAVHYIESNPVKAGLASTAEEWPFSSASRRVERER